MPFHPYPDDGSHSFRETGIRYASVMKFPRYSPLAVTLSVLILVAAGPALAQSSRQDDRQETSPRESSKVKRERQAPPPVRTGRSSLSDAVRRVQRETGGQVLGAERVQFDGRDINRIKVMDDRGRVRYMDDDPQQRRGEEGPGAPARSDNPPTP